MWGVFKSVGRGVGEMIRDVGEVWGSVRYVGGEGKMC